MRQTTCTVTTRGTCAGAEDTSTMITLEVGSSYHDFVCVLGQETPPKKGK